MIRTASPLGVSKCARDPHSRRGGGGSWKKGSPWCLFGWGYHREEDTATLGCGKDTPRGIGKVTCGETCAQGLDVHPIPRETPIWEGAQLSSVWDDAFDKQQVALLAKDFPTRFSAGISGKELGGLKQARLGRPCS